LQDKEALIANGEQNYEEGSDLAAVDDELERVETESDLIGDRINAKQQEVRYFSHKAHVCRYE
jgi:hypothetical protein